MPDFLTKEQRSHRMSLIRGTRTGPEERLAKILDKEGIRYERYRKDLPGNPDFVTRKVAIFVDGIFWHGKGFDSWKGKLSKFWHDKITSNMHRDKTKRASLRRMGWRVVRLWETDLKNEHKCISVINRARFKP